MRRYRLSPEHIEILKHAGVDLSELAEDEVPPHRKTARCKGITRKGTQCTKTSQPGTDFCGFRHARRLDP